MNGTMFFDSIGTQDQKVFGMTKKGNGDIQIINKKLEITSELVGLPLNFISNGYTEVSPRIEQSENKEVPTGLYRPISPHNDDDFASYGYRNSPSPQDGNI